ncbi:MAG: DUF4982 domain-containing protein [Roseburia sp.]|nr:DUF4982 domain-containing protein [Roseburia sp.]MCM1097520.1 DUF4982 domain-containing protein [Ruminococcus flavefaciens]
MDGYMLPFYSGWTFLRTELDAAFREAEERRSEFEPVELPHDWLIYDVKNLYRDGCGWYRKEFEINLSRDERAILRFDGVYMDSTVYVNGNRIGDWKYGYSTFDMDITPALKPGKNSVLVQVRFQSPNSRWYSGAGIYRKVWLKICPPVYLPLDGTYVTVRKCEGGFRLEAETEIAGSWDTRRSPEAEEAERTAEEARRKSNAEKEEETAAGEAGKLPQELCCRYRLWKDGELIQELGWSLAEPTDGEEVTGKAFVSALIPDPVLWDLEDPQCYRLSVELCSGNGEKVFDRQDITIGFRILEFTADQGLFLNGRHVKIHGVCEHHDLGCLGAAFHAPAMERKIRMLQKMGVNAIRTSHNMPAPELMEMADRMGMLILSEAFDMWERSKTKYDYGRFFGEWCERDVRSWVRRDRNHPSLLLWSIGNEIYDTHADEHGQEITRRLVEAVRQQDPKVNALITIGSNYMPWENARKCADIVKVAGYNYGEACYKEHHRAHPDWMMYGSETGSVVQSRGIYHFPLRQEILSEEDLQCSSLGNSSTSWGARSWQKCITDDRDPEYIWGQFLWTGFDYIGEPTPYHTKNSYFGQIDTAGFPKDSYYVFQAEWTDVKKAPMVHLFPYWDFNPGQIVDVQACTNAPCVELFVNGQSRGKQQIDHARGLQLVAHWQAAYEPGTITAVAYDEEGVEIARDSHTSFGDSRRILLAADSVQMTADGEDMCFVTVSTEDEKGNPVENAADYVKAQLSGPGRILGMDNGDSTDFDDYKTTVRKLFSGKLLIVVGSTYEAGEITLRVSGRDLEPAELKLCALPAEGNIFRKSYLEDCRWMGAVVSAEGNVSRKSDPEDCLRMGAEAHPAEDGVFQKSAPEDCRTAEAELPARIPIRKLELSAPAGRELNGEKKELLIEARVYPENTTDKNLVWEAVNEAGIRVGFAKVEGFQDGQGRNLTKVKALGDGDFYVRCMAKDGVRALVISQLECRVEGMGEALLNPYEFLSAGLYTKALGDIGSGNEKGIATARGAVSGVVFENLDFGEYGSDRLTISVFALSGAPYPIEIWLGMPYEAESVLLDTVTYQKPSIWNVYQEETYRLPRRIRGVAALGFVLRDKVHLKGFSFEKQQKAFSRLCGGEADAIYGDSFTRDGNLVRGIGNNVTIVYDNMDFGEEGAGSVTVCGSTPLDANTIHIHFTDAAGETVNRILEFPGGGAGCEARSFPLERLRGKGRIELIFLPGSDFDLEYLQFGR